VIVFAYDLHVVLAAVTAGAIVAATVEGAVRAVRGRPPGAAAERTRAAVLLAVVMTAAGGLALLAGGHRPAEWLHAVYATLAFGLVPVADNAAATLRSDRGMALARLGGGLAALVVVARLLTTG
jgi:hypothetical protein